MPAALDTILGMLAASAAPVALFAVGATVYGQPVARAIPEIGSISIARLILHPALVAALFLLVPGRISSGYRPPFWRPALPVAANVFVLSSHYGSYAGRSASAILVSTILASFTVPVVLYLLFRLAATG